MELCFFDIDHEKSSSDTTAPVSVVVFPIKSTMTERLAESQCFTRRPTVTNNSTSFCPGNVTGIEISDAL
jgi:hypothetical protein